ncbi:MAG: phosphotransferase [Deltaproteobacteria bacterium]|nr:phosphotransferase [Deltaproteobacteria bacterium]
MTPVLAAWGWGDADVTPVAGGLINQTFVVRRDNTAIAVVQRLHPIFAPEVNLDIEAITAHLAARGVTTPRLIRTLDHQAWIVDGGHAWRALTFVDGETVHRVPSPACAESAGALVGALHRGLADLEHTYAFARVGVHDTQAHLAKLTAHTLAPGEFPEAREAGDLAREILNAASTLPPLPTTHCPRRHCHGDLKISNLLFVDGRASAIVDLDTFGLSTIAYELGDAMRSWCNPNGEDAGSVTFDLAIFEAAIRGWRSTVQAVSADEQRSIVIGLETVCVELAARFCVDVFRDDYFGWDTTRFPSRRAHNFVRSRGQLALALAVRESRDAALEIVLG